ncbi:helix-turn-helix domain-containing protein [Niastella sp. OAS944]|uniref:AraC family transcriptional regulator n=1 Tax=Niastella sp. OAS944 TaxID=2664089 RepID=UPI003470795E|nr:AraC-like DNA-binding protein [Chitinophagaceae bacterium OAS944]
MKQPHIEIHTDELTATGIDISPFSDMKDNIQRPHRDDHYMFVVQSKGNFLWELDFKQVTMLGPSVLYVAPGQVHRYLQFSDCTGWFIFIDPLLVTEKYTRVLNNYLNAGQVFQIKTDNPAFSIIPVIETLLERKEFFQDQIARSLTDSLLGFLTGALIQDHAAEKLMSGQKYQTVYQFKQLVQTRYKELKQVKEYASQLNISPLYLNEIVKQITGFPVSYWIQQTILLEAKRLLYYTQLDVKQIAFELGYEDHTYFSRFFKKNVHMTASEFRVKNHDLSNSNPAIDHS